MPSVFKKILVVVFFILIFSISFTTSGDLSQDLGRHIKIGEIILQTHSVPNTNLFSYTHTDFPFVNHHWLSEVFFYLISTIFGLNMLALIRTGIFIAAMCIALLTAKRHAGIGISILSAFFVAPLLAERTYIRPEIFGYLFFTALIYLLFSFPHQKKLLPLIPVIMLLWTNMHITFVFGLVVLALFLFHLLIFHRKTFVKNDVIFVATGLIIPILNPHGIWGYLYPLRIFDNYGYTIVENQNLFFLNSLMMNPHIRIFFFLGPLIAATIIILLIKKHFTYAVLLTGFWIATFFQIRHMPFFVFAAVPPVSIALATVTARVKKNIRFQLIATIILMATIGMTSLLYSTNWFYKTFDLNRTIGMDVFDEGAEATQVMQRIANGRMFNNFDLGGYAIYKLYPTQTVFIDNRPEAYPKEFIQDVYIKLQSDPALRKKVFQQYGIQTVFFSHTDQTPWAEAFVKDILHDPAWKLRYANEAVIVVQESETAVDIRTDPKPFETWIATEKNYLSLLKFGRLMALAGMPQLADQAYQRAYELNPDSCALNRMLLSRYNQTGLVSKATEVKGTYWYCF